MIELSVRSWFGRWQGDGSDQHAHLAAVHQDPGAIGMVGGVIRHRSWVTCSAWIEEGGIHRTRLPRGLRSLRRR